MVSFLSDLWAFFRIRKKYWMLPLLLASLFLGALMVLAKGSAMAPFLYTLF